MAHKWQIGDRVEGGDTAEDYDTGRVVAIDGEWVEVAWGGSRERTTQLGSSLRAEGTAPVTADPSIVHCCSECGEEASVGSEGGSEGGVLYCPEHPRAMIESYHVG